jgi:putative transposase
MKSFRKNYSASLKVKVALETVKKEKAISQLLSEYGVHANQINQWRRRLLIVFQMLNAVIRCSHFSY